MAGFDWDSEAGFFVSVVYRALPWSGYRPQFLFGQGAEPEGPLLLTLDRNEEWHAASSSWAHNAPPSLKLRTRQLGGRYSSFGSPASMWPNWSVFQISHNRLETRILSSGAQPHVDVHPNCTGLPCCRCTSLPLHR